jgi:hypothetical protein
MALIRGGVSDYNRIFDQVLSVIKEYFEVEDANRYDGHIHTVPRVGAAATDRPSDAKRQGGVRRRAVLKIEATDGGSYYSVQLQVHKDARAKLPGTSREEWKNVGRDISLEQAILHRLIDRANAAAPQPVGAPVYVPPPVVAPEASFPPLPSSPKRPGPIVVRVGHFEVTGNNMVPSSNTITKIDPKDSKLSGEVEVSYRPANRANDGQDRSRPSAGGFLLHCDTITFRREEAGRAKLQGNGGVSFWTHEFFADAALVSYDEAADVVVLRARRTVQSGSTNTPNSDQTAIEGLAKSREQRSCAIARPGKSACKEELR